MQKNSVLVGDNRQVELPSLTLHLALHNTLLVLAMLSVNAMNKSLVSAISLCISSLFVGGQA